MDDVVALGALVVRQSAKDVGHGAGVRDSGEKQSASNSTCEPLGLWCENAAQDSGKNERSSGETDLAIHCPLTASPLIDLSARGPPSIHPAVENAEPGLAGTFEFDLSIDGAVA